MKLRSHEFCIYLIKSGMGLSDAFDEEHELSPTKARNLPARSKLYLLEGEAELWWPAYLGIEQEVRKNRVGAALFVEAADRLFAVTFGQVSHQLCDDAIEREFGLRVTLNCVDPKKLRSTHTLSPAIGRVRRTQLPIEADLTLLDFDQNSDVLKDLSGKVRDEFKTVFSSVSGSDCVRVRASVAAQKLDQLCVSLLKLASLDAYKQYFPQIGKVARVVDPAVIRRLDQGLVARLEGRLTNIHLTVPDLSALPIGASAKFVGGGGRGTNSFNDIEIDRYYDYLDRLPLGATLTPETLRRTHKLVLSSGGATRKIPLHRCFAADARLPGERDAYHLLDGLWYRVDKDYVATLTADLDELWSASALPDYHHSSERMFNKDVARLLPRFICLDATNTSPIRRHGIEPCDLLSFDGTRLQLWHVKRSTISSMLSHLFCQGAASIHILKREALAVAEFRKIISARASADMREDLLKLLDGGDFEVRFVIVTKKNALTRSANLPLFSKITLRRTAKELIGYGVKTHFEFVQDLTGKTSGARLVRSRDKKAAKTV
jgi:uncharacterized protein (TIGR04141 family)